MVTKDILINTIQTGYNMPPDGYDFHSVVCETMIYNGGSSVVKYGVFVKNVELSDQIIAINERVATEKADYRKSLEGHYSKKLNEKVSSLSLLQELSDWVEKFEIGDKGYYYDNNIWKEDDITDHIKEIKIHHISYTKRGIEVYQENTDNSVHVTLDNLFKTAPDCEFAFQQT